VYASRQGTVTKRIAMVAAVAANGVIGIDGGLPWRVRADMRKFRAVTMGKPLVMGRKTFESIGRVLDGRDVIVVTRRRGFSAEGVHVASSLDAALATAQECAAKRGADEICIGGGGEIYAEMMPRARRLYVTHVEARPVGDTRFPDIAPEIWDEVSRAALPPSEGDTATAVHVVYDRRG
jgi:dihydrofolate reductase